MNYDKRVMTGIGVDPEKWDWYKRDYSQYTVSKESILAPAMQSSPYTPPPIHVPPAAAVPQRVDPRPASPLRPALLTAAFVFLALFVALMAVVPFLVASAMTGGLVLSRSLFGISMFTGVTAMVLSWVAVMSLNRSMWLRVPGIVISSFVALVILTNISTDVYTCLFLIVALLGAYGFAVVFSKSLPYRPRVYPQPAVYAPTPTVQQVPTFFRPRYYPAPGGVYGTPGGVAGATDVFSQSAIDAGVKGEQNTAALLNLLLTIPGSTVFHGLKFPGSATADVDHAVNHGNAVYLIDSKMYRTGTYSWDHFEEKIVSPGNTDKENHMDAAAKGYRAQLGFGTEVIPIVIIHGRNIRIGQNRWSANGVGLFTAEEAMDFMGTRIADTMPSWRDNPVVRSTLVDSLKQ